MIEAYTHHALTPMKQAFDDSRWLRQTRDKRSIGTMGSIPKTHPTLFCTIPIGIWRSQTWQSEIKSTWSFPARQAAPQGHHPTRT